jgi:uncharacterized protein YdeI (YjbR/CyaY-like superfamily)
MNPLADKYLIDGCMRCKYGGTPQCKVNTWRLELGYLRNIVLETGLNEEIKWGVPVYTLNGKNVVLIGALKNCATMGFFKGALIADTHKLFAKQGNKQSDREVRFTHIDEIIRLEEILKSYLIEAIAIEKSGQKVEFKKNPEPLPEELLHAFEQDTPFEKAFYALSPGRQRGYVIHFSQPKQSQTRKSRIEKFKQQIFLGIGLHDKYTC